jgi:uncharacterized protein YuzE
MASARLKLPPVHQMNPDQIIVDYDEVTDTLFILFFRSGQAGISWETEDSIFFRVDMDERKVFGLQIESLRQLTLNRYPELAEMAAYSNELPDFIDKRDRKTAIDARFLELLELLLKQITKSVAA